MILHVLVAARQESLAAEGGDDAGAKEQTHLKGSMGQRIQKALQKVEEKKKRRAARRAQWDELYSSKPGTCTATIT